MDTNDLTMEELYGGEAEISADVMADMAKMAETIAVEDADLKEIESGLKERKVVLDQLKEQLADLMFANNCANGHKFDNGLFPKPREKTSYYAASPEPDIVQWFLDSGLEDVRAINWQKMNSRINEYLDSGGALPDDMFTRSVKKTISFSGNGHKKFLEALKAS